jgi:hypothetical protein
LAARGADLGHLQLAGRSYGRFHMRNDSHFRRRFRPDGYEAIAGIYSAAVSGSSTDMASAFASIGGTITVISAPNAGNGITLNQCLLTTNVSYKISASTSIQTISTGTVTPTDLKWVNQGNIGYFRPRTQPSSRRLSIDITVSTWIRLR